MDDLKQTFLRHFGSYAALARALRLSSYVVVQAWVKSKRVPPKYCPEIERLTNRELRCEQLNDSVDWGFVREYCCKNGRRTDSKKK